MFGESLMWIKHVAQNHACLACTSILTPINCSSRLSGVYGVISGRLSAGDNRAHKAESLFFDNLVQHKVHRITAT